MPQTIEQQIKELIKRSGKILITTAKQFSGDGLASSLALLLILKRLNKNAEIIINDFKLPEQYRFLPGADQVKASVKKLKKFIINLDISQTGIEDLSYDIKDNNLRIHLTPRQGVFTPEDLKFKTGDFAYDLIFTLDTPGLESLGGLYDHHRDLFYRIPVINLDHQPSNEQYGHINLVEITSAATAEVIYKLASNWPEPVLDKAIATCLLTGLISKTRSFKTANVSPEVLNIAGELIKLGADRKEIVSRLYQTKTIPTLKLWGKVLSRLQSDPSSKLVWSKLDLHDFTESGSNEKELGGVIEELITKSPLAEVVVLFYQTQPGQTKVLIHAEGAPSALALARQFMPVGDKNDASFIIQGELDQAEAETLDSVKRQIIP